MHHKPFSQGFSQSLSIITPQISEDLTDSERAILLDEFGNLSVEVTEAKAKNGFIVVRYELGDYWVEYSYNEDLDEADLEFFMERDRVKWLKDLANKFSTEEELEEEIEELLGNYAL